MNAHTARPTLSPLHRLWRLLPAERRRRLFARATSLLAPRPDRVAPTVEGGIAVVGELSRPSGLGEAARQMRGAFDALGVPSWGIDTETGTVPNIPPRAALLVHVNPPVLPFALLRLPRRLLRGRRVIGYWAWELPAVPPAWRMGPGFVHEVWALSHFTGAAIATILPPGMPLRVVPIPVATPVPSALRRADFGLPPDAVVVLASFSLASSFARNSARSPPSVPPSAPGPIGSWCSRSAIPAISRPISPRSRRPWSARRTSGWKPAPSPRPMPTH